jgi:hypothetical protein
VPAGDGCDYLRPCEALPYIERRSGGRGVRLRIVLSALWAAVVILLYWGILNGLFWSLEEHPVALICVIAVAGLPIGYFVTRYEAREAQKRSIWTALRDTSGSSNVSIPEPPIEDRVLGGANIDGISFKMVFIHVAPQGIRLDRPFTSVRPISISWREIQRVDRFCIPQKKPVPGAVIRLKRVDTAIVVFPWYESYDEKIPECIGTTQLAVPA